MNRDRGAPRDAAPPTPPGIRVRTTAVRLDERSPRVQSRKSERVEIGIGKGNVHRLGLTEAPGTMGANGRNRRQLLIEPPVHQSPPTAAKDFPLLPDDAAEPPTYPRVQVPEFR